MEKSYKFLLALVLISCTRFETAQSASGNVSDAVAELLTPFLSEMREMMSQMVNNITTIESTVRELTGSVTDLERKFEVIEDNLILEIKSVGSITERVYEDLSEVNKSLSGTVGAMEREMNAVNASLFSKFTEMSTLFERHSNETKSELIDLHSSVQNASLNRSTVELGNALVQMLLPYMNETEDGDLLPAINTSLTEQYNDIANIVQQYKEHVTLEISHLRIVLQHSINNIPTNLMVNLQQLIQLCIDGNDEIFNSINNNLTTTMQQIERALVSEFSSMNAIMRQDHRDVGSRLLVHNDQIETTLAELQTNASRVESKLDSLDMKHNELNMKLIEMNSELEMNITEELQKTYDFLQSSIGTFDINVSSDDTPINDVSPTMGVTPTTGTTTPVETLYECGGTGGWRRVVCLNMTDPNTNCPSNWSLISHPKRTCGRSGSGRLACDSVFFQVSGGPYNSVCGSIRAYQVNHVDGFEAYNRGDVTTIDEAYVSGISLTHGSPRQHIWTFAAGSHETDRMDDEACPCDASINISIPLFVGSDYFCESGVNSGSSTGGFHQDDPLWDGNGCISSSTCCSFNNPPYFTKQLSSLTSDDLEARNCQWSSSEDSPVEFIELYVKDTKSQCTPTQAPPLLPPPQQSNPNTIAGILRRIESKQDELKNKITKHKNETQDLDTELGKMDGFLHNSLDKMDGYVCGGTGGWRRVFYMNMSDPNTNCPSNWTLTSHSKRTCGRARTGRLTCDSIHFPVSGGPYTSVCGSIKAYQYGNTDAFKAYHDRTVTNINGSYVTGISLTHGNPRQHIWTFAAGSYETDNDIDSCPCDTSTIAIRVPTFIEGDYFCESGAMSSSNSGLHLHDPLWDGKGCSSPSTCCLFNGPPYFTKQLRMFTSNAIEARLCLLDSSDDVPVEFMELYVK